MITSKTFSSVVIKVERQKGNEGMSFNIPRFTYCSWTGFTTHLIRLKFNPK